MLTLLSVLCGQLVGAFLREDAWFLTQFLDKVNVPQHYLHKQFLYTVFTHTVGPLLNVSLRILRSLFNSCS